MADFTLKVTKEEMQNAINSFNTEKAMMENSYLKISNEVRTLDGTWNGEASEKFKASFDAIYKNISQTETVMSNIIEKLTKALDLYTQASEEAKSMASGLDEGTSYMGF